MSFYNLSYFSESRLDDLVIDTRSEIEKILQVAQRRNARVSVTGALMFNEQRFTQVLEGSEVAVRSIFASIEQDVRHSGVTILATGTVPYRRFTSWTMAFVGTSKVARAYYRDYVGDRVEWRGMTNDRMAELMLKMISLDQGGDL